MGKSPSQRWEIVANLLIFQEIKSSADQMKLFQFIFYSYTLLIIKYAAISCFRFRGEWLFIYPAPLLNDAYFFP